MNSPHVSIILPTYNRTDLLPRALQSVLDQDYDDLEIIVIDNGSSPETQIVLDSFRDERIRRVRFEKNRGVGGARNEGILLAQGQLIGFIDSDDAWLSGKLSYQVRLFKEYPEIELIFGNYYNINYLEGGRQNGFEQAERSLSSLCCQTLETDFFKVVDGIPQAILTQSFFATPTVMLRASVFGKIGNFDVSLSGPEDFEFWFRAAVMGICFAYTDRFLIDRHKDENSLTSKTLQFIPHYLRALDICEENSLRVGKEGLIAYLNVARGHAWRSLVHANALEGRRWYAWVAYRNSLRFGFSRQALLYLLAAIAGPRVITLAKRFRQAL